ncbi:amidohydrolase family protein [bacterium]|nr:amidohydrolase family protein [candidate division CSSED10-310 bacterium]
MDVLVRNGNIVGRGVADIAIDGGTITAVGRLSAPGPATEVIEAEGKLITPTFVDPHVHLDKALISEILPENKSGTLAEAIALIWEKKRSYTKTDIKTRASRVIEWAIANGTTIMRTHVDVDTIGGLLPMEALLEVRNRYAGVFDLQVVAFPQEGILQDPGTGDLMEEAMRMGADVLGGMPYNERTEEDQKRHIDMVFDLALKYDADIDMHVDETDDPAARTLQYLAARTIDAGYQGRVTAGHTCALAAYDDPYASRVIDLVKKAGINMITNPATNLMLQGRFDKQPIRRGITRVKELIAAGVNVSFGQDCLKDTFYPTFGRADMLEVGLITAHAAQFSTPREIDYLMTMLTENAAGLMKILEYGIAVGNPAHLNILDCASVPEAFRIQPDRTVMRGGRIIATTTTRTTLRLQS